MLSSSARARRTWPYGVIAVVLVLIGVWFGGHPSWLPGPLRSAFVSQSSAERQVQDVMSLLARDYYRPVNTRKLLNLGLQSAVASLGDPYSHYYPPAEYKSFLNVTDPQDSGIGVQVLPNPRGLEIDEVFPGSPAARAGLAHGDLITAAGATSLAGKSAGQAGGLIRGRAGTRVTLTVVVDGHPRRVTLIRRNLAVPVVASAILHYRGLKIGDLKFTQFTQGSATELRGQVQTVLHQGARALVLDLRANPGGLLEEAIKVASLFIPDGTIVTTRGRNQPTVVYTALGDAIAARIPLVVLVDRGTASSAEIVTGALKDRGRAKVVGTHTFGKGVFQEIQTVPGGGALDITVGEYFTPDGHNLGGGGVKEGVGIAPNVFATDNPSSTADRALGVAERVVAAEVR
jgi:carboxyl-terminal processing protease